jgi:hypothetical protein
LPRISTFFGITVAMYYDDHSPPHFHAIFGEYEGQIGIAEAELIEGFLPRRPLRLVQAWAELHTYELSQNWERARGGEPILPILALQ